MFILLMHSHLGKKITFSTYGTKIVKVALDTLMFQCDTNSAIFLSIFHVFFLPFFVANMLVFCYHYKNFYFMCQIFACLKLFLH